MAEVSDWKTKLPDEQRKSIIKRIIDLWKQVLMPNPNPSKFIEVQKTALKIEETIYTSATSHKDYTFRVCGKIREITSRVEDVLRERSQQELRKNMKKPSNSSPNSSPQGEQINNSVLHKQQQQQQPRVELQQGKTPQGSVLGTEVDDSSQLHDEEDGDVVSELVRAVDSLPPINGNQNNEQAVFDAFWIDERSIENLQSWIDWVMNPLSFHNCADEPKQKMRRHFTPYPINNAFDVDPFENCRMKRVRLEEDALSDEARETNHRDDPTVNSVPHSPPNWPCYETANLSDFTQ